MEHVAEWKAVENMTNTGIMQAHVGPTSNNPIDVERHGEGKVEVKPHHCLLASGLVGTYRTAWRWRCNKTTVIHTGV